MQRRRARVRFDSNSSIRSRDWVIRSLNADMPYDQFTVEQIAGDLLPGATPEQRVATGFFRNTLTNREAGTDRGRQAEEQEDEHHQDSSRPSST